MNATEKDQARFWAKVALPDAEGHLLWVAARDRYGYGRFTLGRRKALAHRVSYELAYGPVPEGLQVDHLCRVRHCVAPDHLEAVTSQENSLRGEGPAGLNSRKTHCPAGHLYDVANTAYVGAGRRECRICRRRRRRAHARRSSGERRAVIQS